MANRVEVLPDVVSSDNIAPVSSPPQETTPAEAVPEFYNLKVALQLISAHYERDFPKLSFNTSHQIIDGSLVDFIDTSMGVTVATARIRIRNRLVVNNENGELTMVVHLSDMTFARPNMNISATRK